METIGQGTLWAAAATVLTLLVLILGWLVSTGQSAASVWQANLGAVHMAQSDLKEWPTGQWDDGRRVQALTPAETLFEQALISDENRTAYHRLGLIAMLRRDYEAAIRHLEAAVQLDGSHRGIRKNLAYSYVWAGRFADAQGLLVEIPEAQQEMEVYHWWWATQGRQDLAQRAAAGAAQLGEDSQK